MGKNKFEKGQEYPVNLHPRDIVVTGNYIGSNSRDHVFSINSEEHDLDGFLVLDDHWTTTKEGVVTYKDISSFAVAFVPRQNGQKPRDVASDLLKTLREVGVLI